MYASQWYQKISVQLGAASTTGNIVVTVNGVASNPVPFTVRPGNIYFVATNGKDTNAGSVTSPWASLVHAINTMMPGDTTYVRNGVSQSADDGTGWSSCLSMSANAGTAGNNKALVTYPGESATIGNVNTTAKGGCTDGIRSHGNGNSYWTIAGFTVRGGNLAIQPYEDSGWRIIGNDISCPNGNDQIGCITLSYASNTYVYGNNLHNVGTNNSSSSETALYHGLYISETNAHTWLGWNTIAYVNGGRGIQQNVNEGSGTYDLHIHDNIIHDTLDDGIVMTTLDPSSGVVELYNNLIYNAGTGPANEENSGAWNCMNLQGWNNSGTGNQGGTIQVYNNTMYGCGTWTNPPYTGTNGGFMWEAGNNSYKSVKFNNNIVNLTSGPNGYSYLNVYNGDGSICTSNCAAVSGSNNLFYGNGPLPSNAQLTGSLNVDPAFVQASQDNFHLSASSPAASGGIATTQPTDLDGVPLPQAQGYPIGTYAVSTGTAGTNPVAVSVSPAATALQAGQTVTFAAAVSGTSNTAVSWTAAPAMGTITSAGVFTAPSSVTAQQTMTVTAALVSDPTKTGTATITLMPAAAVSVSAAPLTATLGAGQTQQLSATVTGSSNTGVTWSMAPAVGSLSSTGLYTAPSTIASTQTVKVMATSVADSTKSGSATITLQPTGQSTFSISYKLVGSTLQINWSAPANRPAGDQIAVSSVDAPASWTFGAQTLQGGGSGSLTTVIPGNSQTPGLYEFRYLSNGSVAARSGTLPIGVAPFTLKGSVVLNRIVTASWTAGAGSTSADSIGLFAVGTTSDQPIWTMSTSGRASGYVSGPLPTTKGSYELRYLLSGSYLEVVKSAAIKVN